MTVRSRAPVGVVVMAHGTPASPEDIAAFYTSIRRGRPPPPELLAELEGRYRAIGGTSPLAERTRAQVEGLATALEAAEPGRFRVCFGAKHRTPSIEDAVADLLRGGVDHIVAIVLTPHHSSAGSAEYVARASAAIARSPRPVELTTVGSWHRADGLAALLAERTADALASIPAAAEAPDRLAGRTALFFTAHSVPLRSLTEDDPYPRQVAESASDVVELLDPAQRARLSWGVAWQSAGRTADPWLGPDLLAEIARAAGEQATSVVVCPVGFVSDHLEILYDLDIEAADAARAAGVAFARTASLNDDPRFVGVLARVVQEAAR